MSGPGRPAPGEAATRLELPIAGMTCASCAGRVEKRLNALDGVEASVNYATETASVAYDPARVAPEELVAAVEEAGYSAALPVPAEAPEAAAAPEDPARALGRRVLICAALALPVLAMSMIPALQFDDWQWLALQLATPVVIWGAWPFHRAAWANLRHGTATMDTLISVGVLAAWGWSLVALFALGAGDPGMRMSFDLVSDPGAGAEHIYLEVAAAVTVFILAGRWFESRAKRRAGAALTALLELGAKDVAVLDPSGAERRVPIGELAVGDRFLVRPGERIATDGVVEVGSSAVDASLLTGESVPVEVGPGDEVAGATINAGGRLVVRATRVGADTALAQIGRLVSEAQAGKAPVQRLADRVSAVFVPVVIALSVATLAFWLANGAGATAAFTAAVAVLIIACPCALGLATPTALLVGTGRGAQLGILIRGPEILESTRRVDTVVLDKTGTVTTGRMALAGVALAPGADRAEVLRLAGALEDGSEHPVARAIVAAARAEAGPLPAADAFASREGLGVEGMVEGRATVVGRPELLAEWGLELDPPLRAALEGARAAGRTAVAVAWDGEVRALLAVSDTVKPTSAEAVRALRELGLRPVLLTGDSDAAARAVGHAVGIDEVIAGVLPSEKADVIRRLQAEGRVVAMVGDGVNDAPALAQADLGLAIGTGTDVAIEASDLTLVSGDLRAAGDAIRLSRRTLRTIKANLFWAFAYNVVAIPLAAAGYLNPLIAGATMALSSAFVVANSLRLRRFGTAAHRRRAPGDLRLAARATAHCLMGCAIGEVAGLAIGTALGWGNAPTIALAVALAFLFGYALTSLPLLRSGMALGAVVPLALASDTISIAIMEAVDNAVMLAIPGAMAAGLSDARFWIGLAVALTVAFAVALPVNRRLIARGRGHAVLHARPG
jgi:Cu+-exporting ATPase